MITANTQDGPLKIYPVGQDDLMSIFNVYRQCEDFLALGPVAIASLDMVLADLEISKKIGGIFCGIHTLTRKMIGVIDYVPSNYEGDPQAAYLSLLMITPPHRNRGVGENVVAAIEAEIQKDDQVAVIHSGVQVNNPKAFRFWQRMGYRIVGEPRLHADQTTVVDLRKDIR